MQCPLDFSGRPMAFGCQNRRNYIQLVEKPTDRNSPGAIRARELIRKKLDGTKELEAWETGWKLVPEKKRPREPSVESESAFRPIYEELQYSPSKPDVGHIQLRLAQLSNRDDGLEAWLVSDDDIVWYRVHLLKKVCELDREIAALFRRLRPPLPESKPNNWKTSTMTTSVSELVSKSLGVSASYIKEVRHATTAILEPVQKKVKTTSVSSKQSVPPKDVPATKTLETSCPNDGVSTTAIAETPETAKGVGVQACLREASSDATETPKDSQFSSSQGESSSMTVTEQTNTSATTLEVPSTADDAHSLTDVLPVSPVMPQTHSSSEPESAAIHLSKLSATEPSSQPSSDSITDCQTTQKHAVEPVEIVDRTPRVSNTATSVSLFGDLLRTSPSVVMHPTSSNASTPLFVSPVSSPIPKRKILVETEMGVRDVLRRGAMPLFPPARRNWGNSIKLPVSGDKTLTWPPDGWTEFTPDQKLMAWEYAAMHLEFTSSVMKMDHTRGDLLDKYNFLALPGSNVPAIKTPLRKARYYIYESLRAGPSTALFGQIKAAVAVRDTSVDHLLDILDKNGVPVRL